MAPKSEHLIVDNRRARHDYHLLERVEAGIVLTGTEVKSLRDGRASLQQAYADVRGGEAWLVGAHISVYDQGNLANHDPGSRPQAPPPQERSRLPAGSVAQKGLTLVPTKLYFKNGRVKVELALARGKEGRDKRRDIAKREADRDMQRAIKAPTLAGRRRIVRSSLRPKGGRVSQVSITVNGAEHALESSRASCSFMSCASGSDLRVRTSAATRPSAAHARSCWTASR